VFPAQEKWNQHTKRNTGLCTFFLLKLDRFQWKFALLIVMWIQVWTISVNPLMPNDLQRHHAVSPLKIKIPSKNMREKPTNTPIVYSIY
jgi:hypothetical protein